MVASLFALTDAAGVVAYLGKDAGQDYWAADADGQTRWHGRAAQALKLRDEVEPAIFAKLLKGELPDGTTLGVVRNGERKHKPGWDVTLSAPKSVSVMALVADDRRLIDAHLHAVAVTNDYLERHAAVTRMFRDKTIEHVSTSRLAVASYLHTTARPTADAPADPHLHNHNIFLNMTQRDDGAWRSLESHHLYLLQMDAGAIYRQTLATEAKRLGYAVTIGKDSTFTLDAVPEAVIDALSHRSEDIGAELDARNLTRDSASAAHKATITLATRKAKQTIGGADLVASWRATADDLGFGEEARRSVVAEAEAHTRTRRLGLRGRVRTADKAVLSASAQLVENDATFSAAALERHAGQIAEAGATHQDIRAAITRAEHQGLIVVRAAPHAAAGHIGYTTRDAIAAERAMLAIERDGRRRFAPLANTVEAARIVETAELAAEEQGHHWTKDQREATRRLLTSQAAVTGLQGTAGTGKTSTALKTYAEAARDHGLTVRAIAPTNNAAKTLGKSIGAEPMTVAGLLLHGVPDRHGPEAWIVDEASMMSAQDARHLLARARDAGARLILSGDRQQLASVGAGKAFEQLQTAGMATITLKHIVRQTNPHTREAIEALLDRKFDKAFDSLQASAPITEHPEADIRRARLARDFLKLAPQDRDGTIILDPTREGRRLLTDTIRLGLLKEGTLGPDAVVATVLEGRDLGMAERKRALNYTPGDVVVFRKAYPHKGIATATTYRIAGTDAKTVRLTDPRGKAIDWKPGLWGSAKVEAFAEVEAEFRTGDRIQFTRNAPDTGRANSMVATVLGVDPAQAGLTVTMPDGSQQTLDLRQLADRFVRPGWVQTVHAAQGATADRVMAHMESFRRTVHFASLYVTLSRARDQAFLYTDDRDRLAATVKQRSGAQAAALDHDIGFDISD